MVNASEDAENKRMVNYKHPCLKTASRASLVVQWLSSSCPPGLLVAQWLRIHLPTQGTQVQSSVRKDPVSQERLRPCVSQQLSLHTETSLHA